jgi:hypothetical protein
VQGFTTHRLTKAPPLIIAAAHNAHFTHIHTSTMTVRKAHVCVPRGVVTSHRAAGISRNDASLAKHTMAGEALSYVQGESLKDSAAVSVRFTNSPVTSMSLVAPTANEGVCTMCTDNIQYNDEFADDLGEATVHTEEAIRILITHRDRDSQPLTRRQRAAGAAQRIG